MLSANTVTNQVSGNIDEAADQGKRAFASGLALRDQVLDASEVYEKKPDADKVSDTKASLDNSGVVATNEGMIDVSVERRKKAAPAIADEVLKENVMLYTPGSASFESGIQFLPHSNVGPNMQEQAVVDKTNAESMLQSQYSRVVMPQNGRIHFSNAVVNNIITEAAERSVLTRFRGKENVGVGEELKYHPLGYISGQTGDKSIWAYSKEDLFRGIQAGAEMTSNLEYLPQQSILDTLENAKGGDSASSALAELYSRSTPLAAFDNLNEPQMDGQLDSQSVLPDLDEDAPAEYTDDTDMEAIERLLRDVRTMSGTSTAYAPPREAFFS